MSGSQPSYYTPSPVATRGAAPAESPVPGGGRGAEDGDGNNIYVASLPPSFTDERLLALFSPFGPILSAKVMCHGRSRVCKGYGFVLFVHAADAARAHGAMIGHVIEGNRLQVRRARPGGGDRHGRASPARAQPGAAPPPQPQQQQGVFLPVQQGVMSFSEYEAYMRGGGGGGAGGGPGPAFAAAGYSGGGGDSANNSGSNPPVVYMMVPVSQQQQQYSPPPPPPQPPQPPQPQQTYAVAPASYSPLAPYAPPLPQVPWGPQVEVRHLSREPAPYGVLQPPPPQQQQQRPWN